MLAGIGDPHPRRHPDDPDTPRLRPPARFQYRSPVTASSRSPATRVRADRAVPPGPPEKSPTKRYTSGSPRSPVNSTHKSRRSCGPPTPDQTWRAEDQQGSHSNHAHSTSSYCRPCMALPCPSTTRHTSSAGLCWAVNQTSWRTGSPHLWSRGVAVSTQVTACGFHT